MTLGFITRIIKNQVIREESSELKPVKPEGRYISTVALRMTSWYVIGKGAPGIFVYSVCVYIGNYVPNYIVTII